MHGGASAKGFELELIARPVRGLSFNASYTYSNAHFTDYLTACPAYQIRVGASATTCFTQGDTSLYQAAGRKPARCAAPCRQFRRRL